MGDIAQTLRDAELTLQQAGVDTPRLDARILLAHVLECQPQMLTLRAGQMLTPGQDHAFQGLIRRRQQRQPVSQIIGVRGFWTLDLHVTSDTLDPRPDSETVIEAVLAHCPRTAAPLSVLDFGTGTGCLLLALLSEYPQASGLGVDISAAALTVAARNAVACKLDHRLGWVRSRWGDALGPGRFDVIVSNPPYIPAADIAALEPEVRCWEPHLALVGGDADGLGCYRDILPHMARLLAPGGLGVFEVGQGQAQAVAELGMGHGLSLVEIRNDLGGIARCVVLRRRGADTAG